MLPQLTVIARAADLKIALDPCGNVKADTDSYQTTLRQVFACGDMRRGQSLVVWAFRERRSIR